MSTYMDRKAAPFWLGKELPRHVAYLYKNHHHAEWTEVTFREILDKKAERQRGELEKKVACDRVVPGYVWVFNNNTTFFGGWWIYIKTLNKDWSINFRHHRNGHLVEKAMALFPCGVIPIYDNFVPWADKFSKTYAHVGFKRKRKQGLTVVKCRVSAWGDLLDIGL